MKLKTKQPEKYFITVQKTSCDVTQSFQGKDKNSFLPDILVSVCQGKLFSTLWPRSVGTFSCQKAKIKKIRSVNKQAAEQCTPLL
jgi:hypothetical protein